MDEYDSYAPQILGLLQMGADAVAVETELIRIRTERMELPPYPPSDRPTAEPLVGWWRARERS
jgi:hypothetical protein